MDARTMDLTAVERAVVDAEARTTAEIVCAVATASDRYARAESWIGLLGAVLGLGAVGLAGAPWFVEAVAVVAGFAAASAIAAAVPALRRPIVPDAEQGDRVARAASHVFQVQRVAATRRAGGVLVYASLFEHRVTILADDGARAALGDAALAAARDAAEARLRDTDLRGALVAAVGVLGERLAHTLPKNDDDTDELPNHVRVFHPWP